MSFFNNSRPDLLKNNGANGDANERSGRNADTRFLGEMPGSGQDAPPPFTADARTSYTHASREQVGSTAPEQCTNVLASGARWKGSLKVEDSVRIDGVFSGEIEAKGTVHISNGAEVDAKINADFVVVSGSFRGEIRATQTTELMPSSRVSGEVYTKSFSVQEGATLDATVQMTGDMARNTTGRSVRNGTVEQQEGQPAERRARSEASTPTGQ